MEIGAGTVTHLSYIKHKFDSYYVAETSDFAVNHYKNSDLIKIVKYDGKKLPFENLSKVCAKIWLSERILTDFIRN